MAGYVLWEGRLDASLLSFFCTQAQPDITCRFRSQKEALSLGYSSFLTVPLVTRRAADSPPLILMGTSDCSALRWPYVTLALQDAGFPSSS